MRTPQLVLTLAGAVTLAGATALAAASPSAPACQVTVDGDRLLRCGEPFRVKGANYYPKDAAWHRFWLEYAPHSAPIDAELDRARLLGANTLRIFLIFELFAEGSPHLADLADFLDRLEARGLVALVTLFDFYRDSAHPYCDSAEPCDYGASREHVDAVLGAVGGHPAVLGWDLKNEMDLDYVDPEVTFATEDVKDWAHFMTVYLRERTDRPVTLGFSGATSDSTFDPEVVAEFACACDVDVVSFHWFLHEGLFEEAVATLQARLDEEPCPARPLLLEEFGLHTRACPPGIPCDDPHTEEHQAHYYNAVFGLSEAARLAGEMFWTLNDFSFVFPGASPIQHCMGIWRNSTPWAEPECEPPTSEYCHCEVVDPVDYAEKPAAGRIHAHWANLFYLDLLDSWVDPNAGPPLPGWSDNFVDETGDLLGGAIWRGYNPAQLLWSHTPGHAALTKSVAPGGVSILGWARSPLLQEVDLERFPFLLGRVSSYSIKDSTFGSDAVLHLGVAAPGEATTRLLTVTPDSPFPVDFRLDLRHSLDPATAQNFEIVLELEPVTGNNGYSASYELDSIGLYASRVFADGFECGGTTAWQVTVPLSPRAGERGAIGPRPTAAAARRPPAARRR